MTLDITEIEDRLDDLETRIDEGDSTLEDRMYDFAERSEYEELEDRIDVIETQLEFFLKGIGKIFTNIDFTTYIQEEKEE